LCVVGVVDIVYYVLVVIFFFLLVTLGLIKHS